MLLVCRIFFGQIQLKTISISNFLGAICAFMGKTSFNSYSALKTIVFCGTRVAQRSHDIGSSSRQYSWVAALKGLRVSVFAGKREGG